MTTQVSHNHARCGCLLVSCDACDAHVPKGETRFIPYGPGNSGGDGTFCAECRRDEPTDCHPTCDACGSCGECDCYAAPVIDRRYVPMEEEPRDSLGLALHGRTRDSEES